MPMKRKIENLGRHVLQRRTQLGRSQVEVWRHGGPSNSTLTNIENGAVETVSPSTLRKLDLGLRWEPGSAARVLDEAGDPTPLPDEVSEPIPWRGDEENAAAVTNGVRSALMRHYLDELTREIGPGAAENPAVMRELRLLLEDRELASLYDRVRALPRELQLKVSTYVDQLAFHSGNEEIAQRGITHPFPES